MPPQSVYDFASLGIIDVVLQLFQREMDHVMMMDFVRRNLVTEFEPDSVQEVDLFRREVGCMRSEIKDLVLPSRKIELKRDFWFWIGQALPCQTCNTRI